MLWAHNTPTSLRHTPLRSGGQTPYSLHAATSQQQLSTGDGWHRTIAPMQTLHTTYGNTLPRSWQPPYQQTSNSKQHNKP
ncbi:hypothetical protein OUZ56_008982 [Daphnia magna]|uniref:Uncharacterized protein n=1 Tax=Daphnia magna TaxID=35525 RepID=A0ABR0AEN0_9CRUS|nr:hypothetical protein OUZ56_008982 [Daphnia magna]